MFGRLGRRTAALAGGVLLVAALIPAPTLAAGSAAKLAFGIQPANTAAGATMAAVTVQVEDSTGAVVTTDTSAVTIAIGTNPSSGNLGGTLTQNAVNGVATFSGLSIDKPGTGYTLTATDGSLTAATSSSFNILGATKLAWGVQPTTTQAGQPITPALTVMVEDANGDVVPASTASVGVSILSNPGGGTLSGTATQNAASGVATFSGLSIATAGVGYTLVATSSGLTGATSAAFTITGPAAKLAFGTQPTTTVASATISPSVTVQVQDSLGNVVTSDTSAVTLAIGTNPSSGTLGGTVSRNAVNGVATFNDLSINNAGNGYTLQATDGPLTAATSSSFNIVGPAAKLAFGVQPANTATGATISPPITVKVEDANGNVVASSTASVTLAIGTNAGPGTLGGTTTVNAVNGVATFSNVFITGPGNGYTLTAASSGLTGATSSTFNITNAYHLAFITQPGGGSAGAIWSQQPVVEVLNSLNQVVTSDNTSYVYLAIGTNPASGTLGCTSGTSLRVTNGVATFSGCSINLGSANPYTLSATSNSGYTAATSAAFYVGTGAYHLAFVTQPGGGTPGAAWSQQPVVAVENSSNQVVTSDSSSYVYLAISTNPAGGTLTCTGGTSEQVINGYAYFSGCSINLGSSNPYTLSATSSAGYTGTTSSTFLIGTSAYQLVFVTQPGGGAAGAVWTQQPVVAVENSSNQVVTTDSTSYVYLAIATNPAGGTLTCTGGTTEQVVNGYAYFSGCSINLGSASAYTLSATSSAGYTATTSSAFYVGGSSEQLVFVTQPGGGPAGTVWTQQPVVAVENTANQVMTTDNSTIVYLSIGSNPASGTLSCTGGTSEQVVNGYAYFSGCSINAASTSQYTLSATSNPTWTPATSAGFYITGASSTVTLGNSSAVGVTTSGSFSVSTKVVRKGDYITIKITTSPAMAGADIGIWIAKKVNGVWTNFSPHTGRIADSTGTVYYYYKAGSIAWLSIRARFYGDATHAPAWSRAVQARWIA